MPAPTDIEAIKAATEKLQQAGYKLAEVVYSQNGGAPAAAAAAAAGGAESGSRGGGNRHRQSLAAGFRWLGRNVRRVGGVR